MVCGRFMCLGALQHLKNKFGEGFELHLKLKRKPFGADDVEQRESIAMHSDKDSVKDFIKSHYADATIK